MNKLFEERNIKDEKKKLKKYLYALKNIDKNKEWKKYRRLNAERKKIESELFNNGIKRILFNKEWYYLNKPDTEGEENKKKLRELSIKPKNDLVKYNGSIAKKIDDTPEEKPESGLVKYKGTNDKITKFGEKDKLPPIEDVVSGKDNFKFLPDKSYNVYDIVSIVTPNASFRSIYMGIEGADVQDILDKINPQFEKSDPFDGVFVLFSDNLPKSFIQKGIKIFLLNENKVGKGKQLVKAYTNSGKFIVKYNATINEIKLVKKQEMPTRVVDSLKVQVGPLLEKINTREFQEFINTKNETIHFNDFNTDIDFEEINEKVINEGVADIFGFGKTPTELFLKLDKLIEQTNEKYNQLELVHSEDNFSEFRKSADKCIKQLNKLHKNKMVKESPPNIRRVKDKVSEVSKIIARIKRVYGYEATMYEDTVNSMNKLLYIYDLGGISGKHI